MPDIDGAWLALIGTLFGGAGLKVIEAYLGRTRQKQDHGAAIREELRTELTGLRQELVNAKADELRLEAEIESWRSKYYEQFVNMAAQRVELQMAQREVEQLKSTIVELKARILELEKKVSSAS